jgi:hypothetical protein
LLSLISKAQRKEKISVKIFFKKIFSSLFLTALCLTNTRAATYSNKTFLTPKPVGVNMAMEYSTWHKILFLNPEENQFGSNFQITGFYQESDNRTDLGKYFGVEKKHKFIIGDDEAKNEVFYGYIFHETIPTPNSKGTIKFDPKQIAYGARIDYYQDLNFIIKGLYIKANLPFVKIENNIDMDIFDTSGLLAANDNLKKYFKGRYINEDAGVTKEIGGNLQTNLKKAKIEDEKSTCGFADIDIVLGYKAFDEKKYQIKLDLGLTIPTNNEINGSHIFEPVRGNGGHWAFGGGLDAQIDIWKSKNQNWTIRLINVYNYRYLFKNSQTRTLPLERTITVATTQNNFSQYYLLGKVSTLADQPLIPAANILTTHVDVTPGSQLEALLSLDFIYKNFVFDFGYNPYFREHEALELRGNPFGNDQYGVAQVSFNTNNAFDETDAVENHLLTIHDLDLGAASTPALFSHKLFGGLGWAKTTKNYSALVGIGGSYEFATTNCDLETWALWAKLGVSF